MCTGRVDLAFVLRAFQKGADGVIIGGCWPGECHYVTEGNYDALGNMYLCKKLLAHIGVEPERLRLEWIAASEGNRFAEVMSGFARKLRELGPLGQEEGSGAQGSGAQGSGAQGSGAQGLKLRLKALNHLVPYLKLVEREKLRIPTKSEEAYKAFYESDGVNRLFQDLIADKLALSQIMMLLKEQPLSTGEISRRLGLNPSDVSKHMNSSSRQGLIRYDVEQNCYALA